MTGRGNDRWRFRSGCKCSNRIHQAAAACASMMRSATAIAAAFSRTSLPRRRSARDHANSRTRIDLICGIRQSGSGLLLRGETPASGSGPGSGGPCSSGGGRHVAGLRCHKSHPAITIGTPNVSAKLHAIWIEASMGCPTWVDRRGAHWSRLRCSVHLSPEASKVRCRQQGVKLCFATPIAGGRPIG